MGILKLLSIFAVISIIGGILFSVVLIKLKIMEIPKRRKKDEKISSSE